LLRFSTIDLYDRRKAEFDVLETLHTAGIRCPQPYQFGVTDDRSACYSLLGYVPGDNAQRALPLLSTAQQYGLGITAGQELRRLHEFPHPDQGDDLHTRRTQKYRRYESLLRELSISFYRQSEIERYIEAHLDSLRRRPVALQHDDYHPANLIIDHGRFAGVIDFNRCDWGDPVEDFYKVPWFTTATSLPFARGQIDGYLGFSETEDFWARYNLAVALSLHGSLVYVHRLSPEQTSLWQAKAQEIVETHDFAHDGPPRWYDKDIRLIDVNDSTADSALSTPGG
jgi:aminoglycoside phosphotransferase (APT) family kinase protein